MTTIIPKGSLVILRNGRDIDRLWITNGDLDFDAKTDAYYNSIDDGDVCECPPCFDFERFIAWMQGTNAIAQPTMGALVRVHGRHDAALRCFDVMVGELQIGVNFKITELCP